MRVLVLGKGLMLANIVLGAIDAGAEVVGAFRYEHTCNSRLKMLIKDFFQPAPEVTILKSLKINQIRMKSANNKYFRNLLISLNVDLVIVGTWKERIEPETFNIPTIATVNIHPSLLPKYRGPNPYIQTILHGEEFSGVTIHLMSREFDEGPILKQAVIPITEADTSKELRSKTVIEARRLVTELILDLDKKILTPVNQDSKQATYYPNITGDEKMLDFKYQTSEEISRTIRALYPFLPCYITYNKDFYIVNPYHFELKNNITGHPGEIVDQNKNLTEMTIICKDCKAIKFEKLKKYRKQLFH